MTAGNQNVTPNMDDEEAVTAPLGLKILVVVLGIAIIGMLGLMAYKIMNGDASKPKRNAIAATVATALTNFDNVAIVKPEGSELVKIDIRDTVIIAHYRKEAVIILVMIDRITGKESRVTIPE